MKYTFEIMPKEPFRIEVESSRDVAEERAIRIYFYSMAAEKYPDREVGPDHLVMYEIMPDGTKRQVIGGRQDMSRPWPKQDGSMQEVDCIDCGARSYIDALIVDKDGRPVMCPSCGLRPFVRMERSG